MAEPSYLNATELLVEQQVDKLMSSTNCCPCALCRTDVICVALNNLPPRYVTTQAGILYNKMTALGQQLSADITIQITAAAQFVRDHPHHESPNRLTKEYNLSTSAI